MKTLLITINLMCIEKGTPQDALINRIDLSYHANFSVSVPITQIGVLFVMTVPLD